MPCITWAPDYDSEESQKLQRLLREVNLSFYTDEDINSLTRKLCAYCRAHEALICATGSDELFKWWQKHEEWDKSREGKK